MIYGDKWDEFKKETDMLTRAKMLATFAHEGQTRWDKVTPYITHPQAVSCIVETNVDKQIAWLHDVIEDTKVLYTDLEALKFDPAVISGVKAMTKVLGETHFEYIQRAAQHPNALRVKIADLTHNLSDLNKQKNSERWSKYQLTLAYLKLYQAHYNLNR